MIRKSWILAVVSATLLASAAWAGTFGKVVSIGGESVDVALDEARGRLYIANFTANRIEVMSLATNTIQTSINVAPQPGSISLSQDGHWLLVAHFGNNAAPASPTNALTLIDLTANNSKQTFALGNPPLGVAFGADGLALVITTKEYMLFNPADGSMQLLTTVANVTANTLPVKAAKLPGDITAASVATSSDYLHVFGMGSSTGTFTFQYDVASRTVRPGGVVLASGTLGPRVVSIAQNGSLVMVGWIMVDPNNGVFINNIPLTSNDFSVGTTAIDSLHNLVYAHIPAVTGEAPTLQILDSDNLTLRDRLQLAENTTGKSILNSSASVLYAVSASGVLVLPVGNLNASPRLTASTEDLVFRGNFCIGSAGIQTLTISDPSGGKTPFTVTPSAAGVTVSPSSGVTPATVTVRVDPNIFQKQKGTSVVTLALSSAAAVNAPTPVRVLINSREPDQRGTFVDVPGTLVDVLADPVRNRYYVLRQDKNLVLVFDGSNNTQIGPGMRTYNVPTSLALTADDKYLLVGHQQSQTVAIFDLDTLTPLPYISSEAGGGNVVRSIAVSTNKILASSMDYQSKWHILSLDLATHSATQLSSLGVYENLVSPDTVVATSANGSKVVAASADGTVFLYDAGVDTFTVSRKDLPALSGAYAASPLDQFVIGNNLMDSSLVVVGQLESATGTSSGFAFIDQGAIRTTAPNASSPGTIQRVDLSTGSGIRPTRMVEAPLLNTSIGTSTPSAFTRTLAPLSNRNAIIALTVSGFTVLPWIYDTSVAPPQISKVTSAADGTSAPAPGGLISVFGSQLSPTNLATNELPLPTALGDSCLDVNGRLIPVIFVSQSKINAQLPNEVSGNVTITLHTPGGVSDNFNLTIPPTAPAIFLSGQVGQSSNLATIIRLDNNLIVTDSNPVHRGDKLTIYLTGLGATSPSVGDGQASPLSPLAVALITPDVQLGGTGLPVDFAGLTPGEVGVYQINVSVPQSTPTGLGIPLTITQGGAVASVDVRVVN